MMMTLYRARQKFLVCHPKMTIVAPACLPNAPKHTPDQTQLTLVQYRFSVGGAFSLIIMMIA